MPIRLRITFLFGLLVIIILGLICSGIYYFSYTARLNRIKTRLANRAITTARMLSNRGIFDQHMVQRIDSLTTISLKNKTVQGYNAQNHRIYSYSDVKADSFTVATRVLDEARTKGTRFFTIGNKEAVACHYGTAQAKIVVITAAEDSEGKQSLGTLSNILLISFLVGIAIVLLAGYLFSERLLYPVKRITADVEEISAQNLARRIATGGSKDEWQQLAGTLNRLLDRLQESFELQRRFISNASHELSTPLTSISSQLEISLQRERKAEDYKNVMQSIYQDVRHMSKLTQTLLEFAKASGNAGGLEICLVRIDEIILSIPAEVSRTSASYTVSIGFESLPEDEESLLVYGNETLLLTAVKNIVVNACKYSEDHHADVVLRIRDALIRIIISDQGKGIPQAEVEKIFQPFYRAEENIKKEGFGLGLSLADRIIKLHKGSLEVESKLNEGTRFTILLQPARRGLGMANT